MVFFSEAKRDSRAKTFGEHSLGVFTGKGCLFFSLSLRNAVLFLLGTISSEKYELHYHKDTSIDTNLIHNFLYKLHKIKLNLILCNLYKNCVSSWYQ